MTQGAHPDPPTVRARLRELGWHNPTAITVNGAPIGPGNVGLPEVTTPYVLGANVGRSGDRKWVEAIITGSEVSHGR